MIPSRSPWTVKPNQIVIVVIYVVISVVIYVIIIIDHIGVRVIIVIVILLSFRSPGGYKCARVAAWQLRLCST